MVSHCACPTRVFGGRAMREHRRSSGSIPLCSVSKGDDSDYLRLHSFEMTDSLC
jgi:hypothetical protein